MDETQRCLTCRFWDRGGKKPTEVIFYFDGKYEGPDDDWRRCKRAWEEASPGVKMGIGAADEYGVELATAPNFGCTEWRGLIT